MRKKELIVGISAILTGALICGCSGSNLPNENDDGHAYGHAYGINIEDNNGNADSDIDSGDDDIDIEADDIDVEADSDQELKNPTFSKKYIAGIDFGGKPFWYDEIYETVSATLIYTTDKNIEVYMGQSLYGEHDTLVGTVPISDDVYSKIEKGINQKKLYKIDPGSDENLCDGFYRYIYLYDENDKLLKKVGSYEPTNQKFLDAYSTLQQGVFYDGVSEIYEKQVQVIRYNDCVSDVEKLTEDELIASEAEKTIAPFEDGEMLNSEDWIDENQKCFRVMLINKEDHRLTKDYFFYREDDGSVIPLAVDYPGVEEVGADRHYEALWGDYEAKLEDVNFDGHDDIIISLDVEEGNYNKIHCAYIFEDGEFVYNPSFEKITNYKVDVKNAVIQSELIDGKSIKKKYSYDKESKTFIEIK